MGQKKYYGQYNSKKRKFEQKYGASGTIKEMPHNVGSGIKPILKRRPDEWRALD